MSRRTVIAVACVSGLLVLLLFSAVGYLWTQRASLTAELAVTTAMLTNTKDDLAQTETILQETKDVLTSTETTLGETQATLDDTRADLVQTRTDMNEVTEERNAVAEQLTQTQEERDRYQAEAHRLSTANKMLTDEKRTLTHEKIVLQGQHDHLQQQNGALLTSNERMEARVDVAERERDTARRDLTELRASMGSVQELERRASRIRAEISVLEDRRKPLILSANDTYVTGFQCTGSMEPRLTCLDEAEFLADFQPENITLGASISFRSRACWSDAPPNANTMHRVVDIRYSSGAYYFWPKGDANLSGDCWVPHTAVNGYIIAIFKNTRPENAELRNNVNTAKARLVVAYDAAIAHREANGCHNPDVVCYFSGTAYTKWMQLDRAWKDAWNYYDCWYQNAVDSKYPGHIPHTC